MPQAAVPYAHDLSASVDTATAPVRRPEGLAARQVGNSLEPRIKPHKVRLDCLPLLIVFLAATLCTVKNTDNCRMVVFVCFRV